MATKKRNRAGGGASGSRQCSEEEEVGGVSKAKSGNLDPPDAAIPGVFNDPSLSDLLLRLILDASVFDDAVYPRELEIDVVSSSLRRSRYFDTLLSDRWQSQSEESPRVVTFTVGEVANSSSRHKKPFEAHVSVICLLHTLDFASAIQSPTDALNLLPISLEILFDDLIQYCLRFMDAVPWTEEEEKQILTMVPLLQLHESNNLLSRIVPAKTNPDSLKSPPSEEMLHTLINSAINAPPISTTVKNFVATILRDYPSSKTIQKALDRSFMQSLEAIKDLMGKYTSPDFRIPGNNDEREAMQRVHLHAATTKIKHLYWIVERMVEIRLAENAIIEWSEQSNLGSDFRKALTDENYQNIPGLPVLLTRCTIKLAGEVVSGRVLASQQVRTKLVRVWLPVLNTCRESATSLAGGTQRSVFHELEELFLQIISTLPIAEAQELLQQCLCFSTRNLDDCPHLVSAFKTWFRRAARETP